MSGFTGGIAWTGQLGPSVPEIIHTSKDCGEMYKDLEMKELGASSMDCAVQLVNPVMPIRLQPAQMQTGQTHWMGELLEK